MPMQQHMKISELAEATRTPATTIRFYVKEGLLPQPVRKGRTVAYYSPLHVEQLRYINTLKEESGYTLKKIKQLVDEKFRNRLPDLPPGLSSGYAPDHSDEPLYTGKREEIIQASVRLFLNKGYHEATIADIVDNAAIGRGTFYAYFENKEALFLACADKLFYDLDAHFNILKDEGDPLSRLKRRAYEFLLSFPTLINMLNFIRGAAVSNNPAFKDKLDKMMQQLITPIVGDLETGMENRNIKETDSSALGHILMGMAEYLSYYYDEIKEKLDEDRLNSLFQEGWDMIYNGVRKQ